jgi:hypothetical protein
MTATAPPPDPFEERRRLRADLAAKTRQLRPVDHNGAPIPPATDDAWTQQVRRATPEAQVAIASGARARAERAEARVAALEAELAAAVDVAEPDPRQVFADKNRALFAAIVASDADGRPIPDNSNSTNTEGDPA